MQNRKNCVIYLILGLLAGIFGTGFFAHNAKFTPEQVALRTMANVNAADIQAKVIEAQSQYENKLDTLQHTNTVLSRKVTNTQSALQAAKADNKELLALVDTLIAHAATAPDTATKLADCDTLQATVQDLVASVMQKDSIYDTLVATLNEQLANKDVIITTRQLEYASLQLSFDEIASQQQVLAVQNIAYQKQAKTFKVKNKLLSACIMVLSGITAYGLLRH